MQEISLDEKSASVGKRIVELGIPVTVNIMAIKRGNLYISPNGSTRLLSGDRLFILAEDKTALQLAADSLDVEIVNNEK
jgi:cell volume regulation protein A